MKTQFIYTSSKYLSHENSLHFLWPGQYLCISSNQLLCLGVPLGAARRGKDSNSFHIVISIYLFRKNLSGAWYLMDEPLWIFWIGLIVIIHGAISYKWHKLYLFMYGLSGVTLITAIFYALTQSGLGREIILITLVGGGLAIMIEGYVISH